MNDFGLLGENVILCLFSIQPAKTRLGTEAWRGFPDLPENGFVRADFFGGSAKRACKGLISRLIKWVLSHREDGTYRVETRSWST